ncbi:MAG: RNA polymerase sigma factor [Candidatus Marinimicrobia bacterium]|nr:RNA polymerase sigma factor [Candidatus Neomarinimicrobiota bacterium]
MKSDQALIAEFLGGNQQSFDQLALKYQQQVRELFFRGTGDIDDTNDLAQETFIRVFRNLHRFRGDSELGTWIYRIAANVLNSHFRKSKLRQWLPLADNEPSHDDDNDLDDRRKAVLSMIPRLSVQERKVFILRGLQGLPVKDTALILQTSESTIKVAFHTARKKLKGYFK